MGAKKYPFTQNRELSWLRFNDRVLSDKEVCGKIINII